MAKVSLNKITPIKSVEPITTMIGDSEITIKQYLPINDKLAFTERVLAAALDETGFLNPVRLDVYMNLEIIKTYTNISLTDKMMEDAPKTYDLLVLNNILEQVISNIPENEYNDLYDAVVDCAEHTVHYLSSFVGMMKTIGNDYNLTKMNVDEIMGTLDDPEKIGLVKNILDKIG